MYGKRALHDFSEKSGLAGRNTLLLPSPAEAGECLRAFSRALVDRPVGTRAVLVIPAGFSPCMADPDAGLLFSRFRLWEDLSDAEWSGLRGGAPAAERVELWEAGLADQRLPPRRPTDKASVAHLKTELDLGSRPQSKEEKLALKWLPIAEPSKQAWLAEGLSERVATLAGHIEVPVPEIPPEFAEVEMYPWQLPGDEEAAVGEVERALVVGAVEYSEDVTLVHPHVVVHQGRGEARKVRGCQDYSALVNSYMPSIPFSLPRPWDLKKISTKNSWFGVIDLRDCFWHFVVAEASRKYLGFRHPTSKRLMRASRLPFGWNLSPAYTCEITEALGQLFRSRGVQLLVYCDDMCIAAESREQCQEHMDMILATLDRLGLHWSPAKVTGPSREVTFLGLIVRNLPGHRYFTISDSRRQELMEEMRTLRSEYSRDSEIEPRKLAGFIGRLGFASCVVQGGGGPNWTQRRLMYKRFR